MSECEDKNTGKEYDKGFTLIELLVTIAIIAVLAGMFTISLVRYIENAREAMDINNAVLIRDAITNNTFPSDYQGRSMDFKDEKTGAVETYLRGWVYVDRSEIRCSDQTTALALINAGLVYVSDEAVVKIKKSEESPNRWFPTPGDGDFLRVSDIGEYVFKNRLTVKARKSWNTYQVDVYISQSGELELGASASNTIRTGGHTKDAETARYFQEKLGLDNAKVTPIGAQYH